MSGEHTAFFYGTLMVPDVFFSVTMGYSAVPDVIRNMYTFTPAILKKHIRHRVINEDYPGVIPSEGHSVLGVYVTGITDANLQKLDSFESDEYERRRVAVTLLDKDGKEGDMAETSSYIFLNEKMLEKKDWSFEEFKRKKLKNWTRAGLAFDEYNVPVDSEKTT